MDLRWGHDFSHANHTPYQCPEFSGTIDCRISTLGIDIETPVEWTCEDLQEIMNQDSNPFEALLKTNHPDRDCKEETPAFQHILSDLLRAESDYETTLMMCRRTPHEEAGSGISTQPSTEGWHYANQFHCSVNGEFCMSTGSSVQAQHTFQQEDTSPIQIPPTENATYQPPAEPSCYTYTLLTYDPEPVEPTSSSSCLIKPKPKLEYVLASEVPVPFASFSPPLSVEEPKKFKPNILKSQASDNSTPISLECKPPIQTPKKKCQDSPRSSTQSPAQVVQQTNPISSEPLPPVKREHSTSPRPDTTSELGPFCKAAGIVSSDLDQTTLPDGRTKLPADALKNGIIVELYGHWRQTRSPRRTFVRFLALYFDIKFLDENNPTVVDRLFRRVIAPLLVQRSELMKNSGATITRQLGSTARPKVRKGPDALAEFDAAVFAIPDFVTEPFQRSKDRKTPVKKPPKPTQGQQLIELQARFDAFRHVQRKHNLAFLRHLNRLQAKLDRLTHRLSKRFTSNRHRSLPNASSNVKHIHFKSPNSPLSYIS